MNAAQAHLAGNLDEHLKGGPGSGPRNAEGGTGPLARKPSASQNEHAADRAVESARTEHNRTPTDENRRNLASARIGQLAARERNLVARAEKRVERATKEHANSPTKETADNLRLAKDTHAEAKLAARLGYSGRAQHGS